MNDILRDMTTGHLAIKNGDFVIGNSTVQNQRSILLCQKGSNKLNILNGVGLRNYIDDENPDDMLREARKEFVKDGMTVTSMDYIIGNINFKADYL